MKEEQYHYESDALDSNISQGNSKRAKSIVLDIVSLTLKAGDTKQIHAFVLPDNAYYDEVTWDISNSNIAIVYKGLVTGLSSGTAMIRASIYGGAIYTICQVTVIEPDCSIALSPDELALEVGEEFQLIIDVMPMDVSVKKMKWTSSNPEVVTVSNGMVKALSLGSAGITAITIDNSNMAVCHINVMESGRCGPNLVWRRNVSGILTISGTGNMDDFDFNDSVWGTNLKRVVIEWGVSSIGSYAFNDCNQLTSITIPSTVNHIGNKAFNGCAGLQTIGPIGTGSNIKLGQMNKIDDFYGCTSLIKVILPDSVKTLGSEAFCSCTNLTNIYIPESVTSIGDYSFYNCLKLSEITIPNSVTNIGYKAFSYCESLTNIIIPDNVVNIGEKAFEGCSKLKSITIPKSLTSISDDLFIKCNDLRDVYYLDSVEVWEKKNAFEFNDKVTIHFMDGSFPFTDVPADAWYYNVVKECYEKGLISGTSATTFSPMEPMTRAMVVMVLWEIEGRPSVTDIDSFRDVSSDQTYAIPVCWAVKCRIVHGYGDGTFKPNAPVTREQLCVIVSNYSQYKGIYKAGTKNLDTYLDSSQISLWAMSGMKWAVSNGIINGNTAGYLNPKKSATRAEGAAMLLRMKNRL